MKPHVIALIVLIGFPYIMISCILWHSMTARKNLYDSWNRLKKINKDLLYDKRVLEGKVRELQNYIRRRDVEGWPFIDEKQKTSRIEDTVVISPKTEELPIFTETRRKPSPRPRQET